MPYADIGNDVKLYYDEYLPQQGSIATPIVFLHGFTLDRRMWELQVEYFKDRCHLILIDAKGHGKSSAPESGYSRADRIEDLLRFVEVLNLDAYHLVGLSMGGSTALGYSLLYPEKIKSLTLASTSATGYKVGPRISRIDRMVKEQGLEAARKKWIQYAVNYYSDDQKAIKDSLRLMMTEHSGAPWMDKLRGKYPPPDNDLERISSLNIPTKIFAGTEDKVFEPLAHILGEKIPNSNISIFEGVGHMINMEEPERFNHELDEFLVRFI
ncbi:MAG: alpha/beta fold hydrolase [bacterium]